MQQIINELTAFCTSLQRQHSELISKFEAQELEINRLKVRVKHLEDRKGVAAERSGDDAPIKGRNLDEEEAAAERISDDSDEMATVLTSMDAATVLASRVSEVPTGIPTGSDVVPTASLVFVTATVVTPYRRRKGKEVMVEFETPKKQKVQEHIDAQVARELEEQLEIEDQRISKQIARDAEVARIYVKEELHSIIDGLDKSNETVAKYLQEYQQFASKLPLERIIELISDLVRYQDNYAKVHKYQSQQRKPWSKKQKEDYYMDVIRSNLGWKIEDFIPMGSKEEAERLKRKGLCLEKESAKKLKSSDEVPEEVKSPDEESLSNRQPTSDKEMQLWVELKMLYEHDDEDQLWTHTQNFMHALVEWKLYDMCGVHQVTSKDKEIFMLVEKDYPLRKGMALVMIFYKLEVENYSQMANDLILKIYKIANSPSQQDLQRLNSTESLLLHKMIHYVDTDIVKLVVEIKSFVMGFDEFDKETVSVDGLQLGQADLSCVYALNELRLHEICVVSSKHEADQC
nr:hypothetical protein [Tanacetum cinerariifolium]